MSSFPTSFGFNIDIVSCLSVLLINERWLNVYFSDDRQQHDILRVSCIINISINNLINLSKSRRTLHISPYILDVKFGLNSQIEADIL